MTTNNATPANTLQTSRTEILNTFFGWDYFGGCRSSSSIIAFDDKYVYAVSCVGSNRGGSWHPYYFRALRKNCRKHTLGNGRVCAWFTSTSKMSSAQIADLKARM